MMKKIIRPTSAICYFFLALIFFPSCQNEKQRIRKQLEYYANSLKIIDTHEHQLNPIRFDYPEFNYFSLLKNSYLEFDLVSSSGIPLSDSMLKNATIEQLIDTYSEFLKYSSTTSFAQQFFKGISALYDIPFSGYDRNQIIQVSGAIKKNYQNYSEWFEKSYKKAGFEIMMIDQFWPYTFDVDTLHDILITIVLGIHKVQPCKNSAITLGRGTP